ncbi:hypothetical protein, partial [Mycobacterium asiaticum]|uniref:hypothetical protein n=1 Tax=Mycobacterium asiaticum TaxID=1790 RepID=UPI0007EFD04A
MARQEGGRWDVGVANDAVYVERISESDDKVFDDLLAPEEARALAGLLNKYADKAEESEGSSDSKDSKGSDDKDADDKDDKDKDKEDDDKDDDDEDDDKDDSAKDDDDKD